MIKSEYKFSTLRRHWPERKKLEVRRVSKEMRSLIERKGEAIIQELDAIWEEVNDGMERKKLETEKEIKEVEALKKEIEDKFKKLNPTIKPIIEITDSIDSVKREIDIDIPDVDLRWRVNELEDCIKRMCRCEQKIQTYNEDTRFQLKWSKCDYGNGENHLSSPFGITANPMNGNIYVADQTNHRIQIFSSEGEWIRFVKDDEMKYPQNIKFHNQSIYVQCSRTVIKLNESTEKKDKSISYDFNLRGICTDHHLYVGQYNRMNLGVLTIDLIEENSISLKTEFCKQTSVIRDISLSQESFYVLLSETEFPIQIFSREGILTKCVIKKNRINDANCFCQDQQFNILVADYGDSMVKIFSTEGMLLTQFGEKGSEKGQYDNLWGIFAQFDCIITTDAGKKNHKLQTFRRVSH